MDLRTGLPLKQVLCISHNNEIKYLGKQHASLQISSYPHLCGNHPLATQPLGGRLGA
ncbi:MAG: hypothetical protein QNL01_07920 [Akkermansiaceae bacterium]